MIDDDISTEVIMNTGRRSTTIAKQRTAFDLPPHELVKHAPIEEISPNEASRVCRETGYVQLLCDGPWFLPMVNGTNIALGVFRVGERHFKAYALPADEATHVTSERVSLHDAAVAEGRVPLSLDAWLSDDGWEKSEEVPSIYANGYSISDFHIGEAERCFSDIAFATKALKLWGMFKPENSVRKLFLLETEIGSHSFKKALTMSEAISSLESAGRHPSNWERRWWMHPKEFAGEPLFLVPFGLPQEDFSELEADERVREKFVSVNAFVTFAVRAALAKLAEKEALGGGVAVESTDALMPPSEQTDSGFPF